MRLTDLHPKWLSAGGDGIRNADGSPAEERQGVGLTFDCPCGSGTCTRAAVLFANPLDGKPPVSDHNWQRTGESFDMLTLSPSIQRVAMDCCSWHGHIVNGQVVKCN